MKSKQALDSIIKKSRVHLYKPIQIAEILYHYRTIGTIDPADIETYRNASKKWRNAITLRLVGNFSTSSQKFQDNLFEKNAMPPVLLSELAEYNNKKDGLIENYIYHQLKARLQMVLDAAEHLKRTDIDKFSLTNFISMFTHSPGLKRSIDKVYEITVYALFSTIVRALEVEVSLTIKKKEKSILKDFNRFITLVLGLAKDETTVRMPAKLFRLGVANAADRGLDMWANFGPAVQVKHVSLTEDLAESVSTNIAADKIVLVCNDAEATMVNRIMSQLSFSDKIQGIITLSDLIDWYKICLSDQYKENLGAKLLNDFIREFTNEFPAISEIDPFLKERGYDSDCLSGVWEV